MDEIKKILYWVIVVLILVSLPSLMKSVSLGVSFWVALCDFFCVIAFPGFVILMTGIILIAKGFYCQYIDNQKED